VRNHPAFKHIIQLVILVILVAATFLFLQPLQKKIARRAEQLKNEIIILIERELGRNITYSSISPSIFRFLEIRELTIYSEANNSGEKQEQPILFIERLRVHYRFKDLFSENPVTSIKRISIRNSAVSLQYEKDSDLIDLIESMFQAPGESLDLTFSGKNIDVHFSTSNDIIKLDRLFISLKNQDSRLNVEMRTKVDLQFEKKRAGFTAMSTELLLGGEIGADFTWSDVRVTLSDFRSNLFSLDQQTFQIVLNPHRWEIWKIKDTLPVNIKLEYAPNQNEISLAFACQNFAPQNLIDLEEDWSTYKPWFSTEVTGEGTVRYNTATAAVSYNGDITAAIDNTVVPFPFTVTSVFNGTTELVKFDRLYADSPYGILDFKGRLDLKTLYPQGSVTVKDVPFPTGNTLEGKAHLFSRNKRIVVQSNYIKIGSTLIEQSTISLLPYAKSVDFTLSAEFQDVEANQLSVEGNIELSPELYIQAGLVAKNTRLQDIDNLFIPDNLMQPDELKGFSDFLVDAQLFFTTDLKQFAFACPELYIHDSQNSERFLSLGVAGNNQNVEFHDIDFSWDQYQAGGFVTSTFLEQGAVQFSTSFHFEGYPFTLEGIYDPNESLTVKGNYGVRLSAVRSKERYFFSLDTEALPLTINETVSSVSIHASGYFRDRNDWQLLFEESTVSDVPVFNSRENKLAFSARLSASTAHVYNVNYQDEYSTLYGNGEIQYTLAKDISTSGWLQLKSDNSTEYYNAVFNYGEETLGGRVEFANAPMDRFQELPITGLLSGELEINGALSAPNIDTHLWLENGQLNTDPFYFDIAGSIGEDRTVIEKLEIKYLSNRVYNGQGSFLFESGEYNFSSDFSTNFQKEQMRGSLELTGETAPITDREELSQVFNNDFIGFLALKDIFLGNRSLDPWRLSFRQYDQQFSFTGGPENSMTGVVDRNGSFSLSMIDPLPITLEAEGTLQETDLDSSLIITKFDFEALNTFLNIPFFDLKKGVATGEMAITGAINDPDFNGILTVDNAVAENPIIPVDLGPFTASLTFDGKEFSIPRAVVPVQTGEVAAEVDFIIDHWIPSMYSISLSTLGSSIVAVKNQFGRINVDGFASGELHIEGDFSGAKVTGNIRAHSTTITLGEKLPPKDKPRFSQIIDLSIVSGRNVEFLWPNDEFPILRTNIDTDESLEVQFDNTQRTFSVKGDIDIRGGQIYYFSRSFFLREGSITFNEHQDRFDPVLNARAELREITSTGEDVSIFLVADNTRLSNFTPKFESQPPLANTEIFALLGQSLVTELGGEDMRVSSALVHTGGYIFSQLRFMRSFEAKIKQLFNLDLFSIRTQMIENLLLAGVFREGMGPQYSDRNTNFGRYLDNTTVFLGKYLNEDIFLEAMVSLRVNDPTYEENYSDEGFTIDTEISVEWKTPLALLELTFMPNLQDLFGKPPGVRLALSWGFSF
jgi:translocation and assembly module TamB